MGGFRIHQGSEADGVDDCGKLQGGACLDAGDGVDEDRRLDLGRAIGGVIIALELHPVDAFHGTVLGVLA